MKAVLTYSNNKGSVSLLSGSLSYVDYCTSGFYNYDDLAFDSTFWSYIKTVSDGIVSDSDFHLVVSMYDGTRKELPIIFNDNEPIYITSNHYQGRISEVEKSRKLLLSSKNKKFMRIFISSDIFDDTTNFTIPISDSEAKFIVSNNISLPIISDSGEMRIVATDIFKLSLGQKKLKRLRNIFELSLDMWSDRLERLNDEKIYYYSRNLRVINLEYKRYIKEKEITQKQEPQKNLKRY